MNPTELTKSQIKKLGDRLKEPPITEEDIRKLQALRAEYDPVMAQVEEILAQVGLQTTSRLKGLDTIIEKLGRGTSLSRMQDIAGIRLVEDLSLSEQDAIVRTICNALQAPTLHASTYIKDRRTEPSYGYRAVHIIAVVDRFTVEIQVRTQLQDLWAQIMEKAADLLGREIRYGSVPPGQEEFISSMMELSNLIYRVERDRQYLLENEDLLDSGFDEEALSSVGLTQEEAYEIINEAQENVQDRMRMLMDGLGQFMNSLEGILDQQ